MSPEINLIKNFRRLYIARMSFFPEVIHRFNSIPIKIQVGFFFVGIDNLIQKFIRKYKRPITTNTMLKKKNKVGRLLLAD